MNADFQAGYREACAVLDQATRPGYTKNAEESLRLAQYMLEKGMSAKEAGSQRGECIASIRQRGQLLAQAPGSASDGGPIIRPSVQAETEPDSAIWGRWTQQMGAQGPEPAGEVLPIEVR